MDEQAPQKQSYAERKQARFAQRVEKWEARRAGPPPPLRLHRAIITILMMFAMLVLLYVLLFTHGPSMPPPAAG
jgi:hypothetical protein